MAIYQGIARSAYDNLPGLNWSKLKRGIGKTAAHIAAPSGPDKAAYKFGRAFHHAVFQPDMFYKWEIVPGKTTTKPDAITESERDDIEAMAAAAYKLHQGRLSHIECALTWERDGQPCKAMIDAVWTDDYGNARLLDLKSTQNAEPQAFKGEVFKFRYHGQLAWYLDGLAANGIEVAGPSLLPVEKAAPYAAGLYGLDEWMDLGRQLYNEALSVLAENRTGYGHQDLDVPEWCQPGLTMNANGGIDL